MTCTVGLTTEVAIAPKEGVTGINGYESLVFIGGRKQRPMALEN
jgi:hypothetical protein